MSLEDVGKLTLSLLINAAMLLALFQLAAVTPLNAREAWGKVPGAISGAIVGAVAILLMMVSTTLLAYYLSIGDMQAKALVPNESALLHALLGPERQNSSRPAARKGCTGQRSTLKLAPQGLNLPPLQRAHGQMRQNWHDFCCW